MRKTKKKTKKTQERKIIEKLIKHLKSNNGFGKETCKEFSIDCGNCKGHILIGMLEWYLELLNI